MSDTPAPVPNEKNSPAAMRVLAQYLKDLSFESPNAPLSIQANASAPAVDINVDLNARSLEDDRYEVELACSATAKQDEQIGFVVEIKYSGLFHIKNVPETQVEAVLLIECPRLLFPYVRQIISNAVRDGGFPPLMLEPIDFASLYLQQRKKAIDEQGNSTEAPQNS